MRWARESEARDKPDHRKLSAACAAQTGCGTFAQPPFIAVRTDVLRAQYQRNTFSAGLSAPHELPCACPCRHSRVASDHSL
jgi:hypothetical protein